MFGLCAIKNADGAAKYFTREDNYYLSEVEAKEMSSWMGKGAKYLGLTNRIDEQTLQNLLDGRLPNGSVIGLQKDGSIKHRAGFDLTFSAPKSVSILVLDGGNKQLYKAHLAAVDETLKLIERDCAQAKVYRSGKISFENTKNLIIARVGHTTSRKLDVQLHDHALIMNATKRGDGKWRALASSKTKNSEINGFAERVYQHQIYYGVNYRAFLANKIQQLGYEIENVGPYGLWEIKGVSEEARNIMSKRRREILKKTKESKYSSLRAVDYITLNTRDAKPADLDVNALKKVWKEELASVGFSSKEFIKNITKHKEEKDSSIESIIIAKTAKTAIRDSIEYLSQYKLKLDYERLVGKALELSIGATTHQDIVEALDIAIKNKELIAIDKTESAFVTKGLIENEKIIMDFVQKGRGTALGISFKNELKNEVKSTVDISGPSVDTAIKVLESKDRLSLVDHRGVNTEKFVSTILQVAEQSGKTVRVLSPNSQMANDMNRTIKRKPTSLWQWLMAQGKPEIGDSVAGFNFSYKHEIEMPLAKLFRQGKDVIIVDAAEKLGNMDMQTLLQLTEKTRARVIFLNDLTAKRGIMAGNAIETLKHGDITKHILNIFSEQRAEQNAAIIADLQDIKDNDERILLSAKTYAFKDEKERSNTLVVVGSRSQIKPTNKAIREELKEQGKLGRVEHEVMVLNPVSFNKVEGTIAKKYQKNMVVRVYKSGIYKDWSIANIDKERNVLVLDYKGKRLRWNLKTTKENFKVFQREKLLLASGDKLQATANMHTLYIKNAEQFVVQEINNKHIKIAKGAQVKKISLKILKDMHFDYNYATTLNRISKRPAEHLIANMKAYSLDKLTINTLRKKSLESLTIFTNDAKKAIKRFEDTPVKLTATEVVLNAAQVERLINEQTFDEIKNDVEKAIVILGNEQNENVAKRAVNFAIEKITSRSAGFTHKELVTEALVYVLEEQMAGQGKNVIHKNIIDAIGEKRSSGELVMGKYFNDGTRWTTKEILDLERAIVANLKSGQDKFEPFMDSNIVNGKLENTNLTQGQKDACYAIVTGKNQFIIAQGDSGTGKTTMYMQLQKMLHEKVAITAFAPTHQAVKELKDRGIEAQTLKSFLVAQQKQASMPSDFVGKFFILDEASMVDNKDFADFTDIVVKNNGRAAISGDIRQLISPSSGKPYEISQRTGSTDITYLSENLRQQTPSLKQAVKDVLNGDYKSAFEQIAQEDPKKHIKRVGDNLFFDTLQESIVEVNNANLKSGEISLEKCVAEDYLTRTSKVRDNTVVIVHAHDDRKEINQIIREGLKGQGVVRKEGVEISRLVQKGLTDAEHKILSSYNEGDIVKLGRNYYHVAQKKENAKSILLCNEQGETKYFYPEKYANKYNMEVYKHAKAELAVGDIVRLTKTDKERERYANFEYSVKNVTDDLVQLASKDGKHFIELTSAQLKDAHWDYAYTITGYGVQGSSKQYVIDYEVSYRKKLANQRSFYVAASRAKQHLIIYTNDKEKLLDRIISNTGDKPAALEVVGELDKNVSTKQQYKDKVQQHGAKKQPTHDFIDANQVTTHLHEDVLQVVQKVLGEPKKKLGNDYQYSYSDIFGGKDGKHEGGSLFVAISGPKQGQWHCFKNGEHGNLLTLIQKRYNLDFKHTLEYAIDILGFNKEQFQSKEKPSSAAKPQDKISSFAKYLPENWTKQQKKSVEHARRLVKESIPIDNTIAQKYLRKHRGINADLPEDFRFHPAVYSGINDATKPALLIVGKDKDGEVQVAQAIFLDEKTANKAEGLKVKKQTWGVIAGAPATIGNKDEKAGPIFVAEGPETAMSILESIPKAQVKITFGKSSFRHVHLSASSKDIVFCLDNDVDNQATEQLTESAAKMLRDAGKNVWIAKPEELGKDYNDLIKEQGVEAVRSSIERAVPYEFYANDKDEIKAEVNDPNQNLKELLDEEFDKKIGQDHELELRQTANIVNKEQDKDSSLLNKFADYNNEINIKRAAEKLDNIDKSLDDFEESSMAKNKLSKPDMQKDLGDIEREIC